MSSEVTLLPGLPEQLRGEAARLYWQAFGGKLGRIMGPTPRALAFFERVIRADQCLAAVDPSGGLVGIAGFKTPEGSFAGGTWADLCAVYGPIGGRWRGFVLRLLARDVDNDRFLVDGIAVAPSQRGRGIGAALLKGLCHEARARGYREVRLDVVAENTRARALYDREGFRAVRTERLGLLRPLFGFSATITMVRSVPPARP